MAGDHKTSGDHIDRSRFARRRPLGAVVNCHVESLSDGFWLKNLNLFGFSPIEYFNRWFVEPIRVASGESVQSVVDALNSHPLNGDETAFDYVMPPRRYREKPGRFRILGENQDIWYCFVYHGEEKLATPPVYFETSLCLKRDHGFSDSEIIGGDHVMVSPTFTSFLWQILGRQICIRMEGSSLYAAGVHGVVFRGQVHLDDSFINSLGREFPPGYTCYVSPDTICVPDWGAAFLNPESARRFFETFGPTVSETWA